MEKYYTENIIQKRNHARFDLLKVSLFQYYSNFAILTENPSRTRQDYSFNKPFQ